MEWGWEPVTNSAPGNHLLLPCRGLLTKMIVADLAGSDVTSRLLFQWSPCLRWHRVYCSRIHTRYVCDSVWTNALWNLCSFTEHISQVYKSYARVSVVNHLKFNLNMTCFFSYSSIFPLCPTRAYETLQKQSASPFLSVWGSWLLL